MAFFLTKAYQQRTLQMYCTRYLTLPHLADLQWQSFDSFTAIPESYRQTFQGTLCNPQLANSMDIFLFEDLVPLECEFPSTLTEVFPTLTEVLPCFFLSCKAKARV